ncbi:hypothetical protein HPO_12348 [Hyphomonas polymorpha PS728]|uniref:Lipoprotein n=1 Tax=Hyphomonas polymorpha PS728 TaxID=1280954 RepID=A0A062VJ47_9PROT|nr:DUF6624 domain-containing protein [Hyphomonas polymorpha]KCZ98106.1 hypothetical protein HPO_12348 [Hyphomonas polymorpha PS728]
MRYYLMGLVMAALGGFAAPSFAGEPAAPPEEAAPEAAEEEKKPKANLDLSDWLATPPAPHPQADEVLAAWTAERDAILAGEKAPFLDWHQKMRDYQQTSDESDDPFVKEVYRRVALDQYGRMDGPMTPEAPVALAARLGFELDEEGGAAFGDRIMRALVRTDLDNTAFLQRELEARGGRWWTVEEVGADTASNIWLLTQHADQTPAFQQMALEKMAPLLETGNVNRNNYAYLWDRVAVAQERPQRFGTQGRCMGPGDWVAFEIEAPAEEVNARRAAFDIQVTFEENKARIDAMCPQ